MSWISKSELITERRNGRRVTSDKQETPQMKWVRQETSQASEAKSHKARQDHEGIELGLTEDLKAFRVEISAGEVKA
ncbi:hypothetical protein V6N11_059347 [Hibiscus sabdariffa]|uniref:Uncharacterized protein n=1 Tax=Hibiscus sabdariffa TaxID=183260 RepID=A0ABR2U776_9ROSI